MTYFGISGSPSSGPVFARERESSIEVMVLDKHYYNHMGHDGGFEGDWVVNAGEDEIIGVDLYGAGEGVRAEWLIVCFRGDSYCYYLKSQREHHDTTVSLNTLSCFPPTIPREQYGTVSSQNDVPFPYIAPSSSDPMLPREQQTALSFTDATNTVEKDGATNVKGIRMDENYYNHYPALAPHISHKASANFSVPIPNSPEGVTTSENCFDNHPNCPPPAPRLSSAVPVPSASPNVPPPYVLLPITGPIYYTCKSPQRQVHEHIDDYTETQRCSREKTSHHQHEQLPYQHVGQMTPRHARARVTFSSAPVYSTPMSDYGSNPFNGSTSSPITGCGSTLLSVNNSSSANQGGPLIYDTAGTVYSSPIPPKKAKKRVRFLLENGEVCKGCR
ncbi:hypothetical protein HDK90DRAFT_463477 [Phyllosticta capitalensis]|uniref:Uncharacterized protein n=1 Tax=Phyllosticta capitalensis TaxID=121624 RepID=A0ABR1Z124_9PEZI